MTTQRFFKGVNILHRAFLAGSVLTILFVIYMKAADLLDFGPADQFSSILLIVTLVMGVWGIAGALFISNKLLKKAAAEDNLSQKMTRYREVLVIRSAITEGAALLAAVAYMMTGSMVCLLVAVICTAFLGFMRPDKDEAKRSLQLSSSEAMKLDREEAEWEV